MKFGFLSLKDFSTEDILSILETATDNPELLKGKKFALLFQKGSLRTRCSFEIAINDLGGFSSLIDWESANFHKADLGDEAKVMSSYYDGIIARLGKHSTLETIHSVSDIPVINALTDLYHPCQALADIMTIKKYYPDLSQPKIVFLGPATNVSNSLTIICKKLGMNIMHCGPREFAPDTELMGTEVDYSDNPEQALSDADIIYTDVWVSICYEGDPSVIVNPCMPYQLNQSSLQYVKDKPKFMHCMPITYDHEVTKDVMDSMELLNFEQADNRIVAQKALLTWIYNKGENNE